MLLPSLKLDLGPCFQRQSNPRCRGLRRHTAFVLTSNSYLHGEPMCNAGLNLFQLLNIENDARSRKLIKDRRSAKDLTRRMAETAPEASTASVQV